MAELISRIGKVAGLGILMGATLLSPLYIYNSYKINENRGPLLKEVIHKTTVKEYKSYIETETKHYEYNLIPKCPHTQQSPGLQHSILRKENKNSIDTNL